MDRNLMPGRLVPVPLEGMVDFTGGKEPRVVRHPKNMGCVESNWEAA